MPRKVNDTWVPDTQVSIKDFGGFQPNADPNDLPPGAAIQQVNATSMRPGELRARPGVCVIQFD